MSQIVVWECTAPENEIKSCVVVVICVTVWSPSSATSPEVDRAQGPLTPGPGASALSVLILRPSSTYLGIARTPNLTVGAIAM